ncbi:DNA methylase [Halogranum amylolyticum]|uniref:Type II methyltransferase n=1 Tax=Halogranum amylolyticum TaxID=660520 RepID=A0A1H8QI01_9EURY|nr:DNA methyltransferase [Halogranum amylolyticum]SEO53547.1 DNA methylase [Halogranum amylolyticum]
MQTYITVPYERPDAIPDDIEGDDWTPETLVERVVETYTDPGETVLDPFAGFGTTLAVAERLDRIPYGVEFDSERAAFVRDRVDHGENVVHGDVFELDGSELPTVDLCHTSPPFIAWDEGVDPFRSYDVESRTSYERYLDDVERLFDRVTEWMRADSTLVVDVANLKNDQGTFTLAWDVGRRITERVDRAKFRGETVVVWEDEESDDRTDAYGHGYDHSYCLVYDVAGGAR